MKKILSTMAAIFVLFISVTAHAESLPFLAEDLTRSAVEVSFDSSFGVPDTTCGIVTGKKADYILVSSADISGAQNIVVKYGSDTKSASIAANDPSKGVAVLSIDKKLENTKAVRFRRNLKNGEEIYIVDLNSELDPSNISYGLIEGNEEISGMELDRVNSYIISADVEADSSGAILADKFGNAVGMCFYDGDVSKDKAVKADEICAFFDNNEIPYKDLTAMDLVLLISAIVVVIAAIAVLIIVLVRKNKGEVPMLVGVKGEHAGSKFPLDRGSYTIGRDTKSCQVVITGDLKVSRCHCSVSFDNLQGMFVLTDLSSTHGTVIDGGEKLQPKVPKYLPQGSTFYIGSDTAFALRMGRAE